MLVVPARILYKMTYNFQTDGSVSPQDRHKPAAQQKLNLKSGQESVEKFAKALDTNKDGFVGQ